MSAFAAGFNLAIAMWCGIDWLKEGGRLNATFFWVNAIFAALNALVWLA